MAIAAIQQAQTALALVGVEGEIQRSKAATQGKGKGHWAIYVLNSCAVAGTIVAVAALILGQFPLVAAGSLLAATNGIASYHLREFSFYQQLQFYVRQLATRVNHLQQMVTRLEKAGHDLKDAGDGFQRNIIDHKQALEQSNQQLRQRMEEVEALTEKLTETKESMDHFKKLYEQQREMTEQLSKERHLLQIVQGEAAHSTHRIENAVSHVKESVAQNSSHIVEVKQIKRALHSDLDTLGQLTKEVTKELKDSALLQRSQKVVQISQNTRGELQEELAKTIRLKESLEKKNRELNLLHKRTEQSLPAQFSSDTANELLSCLKELSPKSSQSSRL